MIKLYRKLNAKRKITFWVVITGFFLIILLVIAGFVLQNKMPENLKASVNKKSEGIYKLTFESMKVSLLKGQIKLNKAKLTPELAVYDQAAESKQAPQLYEIEVDAIDISGLGLLKFFISKRLKVGSITVLNPQVRALHMKEEGNEEKKSKFNSQLPDFLQKAIIGKLAVKGLSYNSVYRRDSLKNSGKLTGFNVEITDIALDSSINDSSRVFFAKNIRLYGRQIEYKTNDSLYTFHVTNAELSTAEKKLEIDTLQIVPSYTEKEFSTKLPFKQDRYDMIYPKITVRNIDFKYLETHGRLPAQTMEITRAIVHIFADKGMKEKRTIASNNFPALAFQRLSLPITIDTIRIKETDIYYKELNPKSQRAGTVLFSKLTGELLNVSNDSIQLKKNNWIRSHFTTFFLGKPVLSLNLNFDMTSKEGRFNYQGSLTGAPASFYNQLLVPIALARAEKGYVKGVKFNVNANRYQAHVMTELLYNDLKIAVLEANSGEIQKKGFLSLFVNWVAVKSDNPSKKEEKPRIANLVYEHPQENTFFNLMWKSIYAGFKVNLGLPTI